jgi:hypothetical protein
MGQGFKAVIQFKRIYVEVNSGQGKGHETSISKGFQLMEQGFSFTQFVKGGTEIEVNWRGAREDQA